MMKILTLALAIFSSYAFSATGYKIEVEVLKNGKLISRNKLIAERGLTAKTVKENTDLSRKTSLEIVANEGEIKGNKGILLKMNFMEFENGKKVAHTKPEVLVKSGKEATLETYDNQTKINTLMKIIATRMEIK